ncbi:unnamed protein product [Menidia menidia]|uniref:(Atlantic silverside) hypothetical protein n=1 Tax=Menidia menidia TaxID=238744 RepID=A0A8S4BBB5_9TELE|nr:unnamed protein product [Menidia menidia]
MADAPQGPMVSRPLLFATEERRAVHSWSRISSAGHNVLLDALKILSPVSRDISSTEELVTFLQELSEEGHKPTVLHSKDVYAYRSCTSQPLTEDMLRPASRGLNRPASKKRRRRPLVKKREVHPSWNVSDRSGPRIQGVRPPEALVDHRAVVCSRTPNRIPVHEDVQPFLRLTNIEGMSGFPTARLQIHAGGGGGGGPTRAVALFSQKSLSCPIRLDGALIGDSAPVFYANGRAFPETHTELSSNGWRGGGGGGGGGNDFPQELPSIPAQQRNGWKDKKSLRRKVVKVDDSRSVAEACIKAQKILQVNLCPVIQIQPLNHVLRDFRFQNK